MKAQSKILAILGLVIFGAIQQAHAFRTIREETTNPGNAKFQQIEVEDADVARMRPRMERRFRDSFNGAWQQIHVTPDGTTRPGLIWGKTVGVHSRRSGEFIAEKMIQSSWYMRASGHWDAIDSREGAFEYCLNMNPSESDRQQIALALQNNRDPAHGIYLPRYEDFHRLSLAMGIQNDWGISYHPQLFQNFTQNWYKTSTVVPNAPNSSPTFSGFYGSFFEAYRHYEDAVLCVMRP